MLKPISKRYFYSRVERESLRTGRKLYEVDIPLPENRFVVDPGTVFFMTESDVLFVYLPVYRIVVIPSDFPDFELSDTSIDFSDWSVVGYTSNHDPKYTLNLFRRTNEGGSWSCYMPKECVDLFKSGTYTIENKALGIRETFEVKSDCDSNDPWWSNFYVAYPEKLALPFDARAIEEKDKELLNELLWTQRKH